MKRFVVGVDFGTDSARAVLIDGRTGEWVAEAVARYKRWAQGLYQDGTKRMFRQHPKDYMEALTECVQGCVAELDVQQRAQIAAIAVDTTGSTPCPVDRSGVPLALMAEFEDNPNAMFHLWKDHTAILEAEAITTQFRQSPVADYTRYQGDYASEWFWAKVWHTVREDQAVR
ncbi:MAG: FGGY family carbohydrate kinase, partial [Clostridia bacterium]